MLYLRQAEVHIVGGTAPYNISWSMEGATVINGGTTTVIENLISGEYTVMITDSGGLTQSYTFTVNRLMLPIMDEFGNPVICDPVSCPYTVNVSNIIPEGTHQANLNVSSNGKVQNGEQVLFRAGEGVLLEAGFEVEFGADFSVDQNRDLPEGTELASNPSLLHHTKHLSLPTTRNHMHKINTRRRPQLKRKQRHISIFPLRNHLPRNIKNTNPHLFINLLQINRKKTTRRIRIKLKF